MTARPNENDPIDLDPAREPAYEIEDLSKTGSELLPRAINPKKVIEAAEEVPPGTVEPSERARSEENVEREIPQPSSIERESDNKDDRKNESIEGGQAESDVEREDDQRGAA